ncbi:MAG: hypothetical protein C0179_05080 [Fervidicoccus sp.]|nr:MAG: hypothetical protein C0179_05080 [Fervidicoccus sp.]
MSIFKKVSKKKFAEIEEVIRRFIESRGWIKTFRLKSLDEDKEIKDIIEFFEKNSTIKGSVGDATIYVIPVYHYDPSSGYGDALIASLIIEKDQLGYTVKIGLEGSWFLEASSREEVEKHIDEEWIGRFVKLLKKALETRPPLAIKLAKLVDCLRETDLINFLYRLYGYEILSDNTIPGLHSVCSGENNFFANNKIIIIPDIDLRVIRDTRSNKIFKYDYRFPPRKRSSTTLCSEDTEIFLSQRLRLRADGAINTWYHPLAP